MTVIDNALVAPTEAGVPIGMGMPGVGLMGPRAQYDAAHRVPDRRMTAVRNNGEHMIYGEAIAADKMSAAQYLPEGSIEPRIFDCVIPEDQPIWYSDAGRPAGRLLHSLRTEQTHYFDGEKWPREVRAHPDSRTLAINAT